MKDADYAPIGPNSAAGAADQHFDTVLYEGTHSSGPQRIGGLNFQPDLVWIKTRNQAQNHVIFDSLRGNDRVLYPTTSAAEAVDPNALTSFNPDGFSLGIDTGVNYNAKHHVAWCWKAGNGTVENTNGTIASTVSVNSDAGFSIVSYTGNGITGATVGHGLSQTPVFMIQKKLSTSVSWRVYHRDARNTTTSTLHLDTSVTDAVHADTLTTPNATTFTTRGTGATNPSGAKCITYCWHEVIGYSKFASWTGSGNTNGPFVYCGFKPALVIIKLNGWNATAGSWRMFDNKRDPFNPVSLYLEADETAAEVSAVSLDFLSNGFKLRAASPAAEVNNSGLILNFMAWAEMPFKYATAR